MVRSMKHRLRLSACAALVGSLLVAGCGGGGGALPNAPAAPKPAASGTADVALVVPNAAPRSPGARRRPAFVSPATLGATIAVGGSVTVVDLSPTSGACSTQGSSRVCSVNVTVNYGTVTFTVTTYDAAPQGNAIPSSAHVLGTGSVTQTIVQGGGPVSIAIDAVVNGFGALPALVSLPADGAQHTYGFALAPTDFGNAAIVNGQRDPYANPIAVTLTESGGSGHAHLVFDGVASGASATLHSAQDTIALSYDGAGAPGYAIAVAFAATGVTPVSITIAPLFVTSASPAFANGTLTLSGANSNVTFTISQANATGAYTTQALQCTNVASVTQPATSNGVTSFVATGGTTASTSGCTIAVSDGASSIAIPVVNVVAATATPSPTPSPTPTPVAIGASVFSASGTQMTTFPLAIGAGIQNVAPTTTLSLAQCCTGLQIPAYDATTGYLWVPDNQHAVVDALLPGTNGSGVVPVKQASTSYPASAVAVDASGNLYLTTSTFGSASIAIVPHGGTSIGATITGSNTGLTTPRGIAVDANGYIYVADQNNGYVSVFAPVAANAGTLNAAPVRSFNTFSGTSNPASVYGLALDAQGRIWIADPQNKEVKLYPAGTSNTASSSVLLTIAGGGVVYLPYSVAVDANGNLWIGDTGQIEEITAASISAGFSLGFIQNYDAQIIGGTTTLIGSQMITTH